MLQPGEIRSVTASDAPGTLALLLSAPDDCGECRVLTNAAGSSHNHRISLNEEEFSVGSCTQPFDLTKPRVINGDRLGDIQATVTTGALQRIQRALTLLEARRHQELFDASPFVPGLQPVPVSGRCFDANDVAMLVDSALDFWLTAGRYNDRFEAALRGFLGVKHVRTVNSGSSANLVAFAALASHKLGARALQPGDEVITAAAGFPTTVNPLLLYGMRPVFVDISLPYYNPSVAAIEAAITPRTRAIMLAHTLGNPFDVDGVLALAERHGLWVIEDCCDALGSTWKGKPVGGFGHLATFSFYPAHHITMGEGGAVATNDPELVKIVESLRDWGRDCWCAPGADNTCRKRFDWQLGSLPSGYDHKYTYSHLGYNLKITDMQAAVGLSQLDKLEDFIVTRVRNFQRLHEGLLPLEQHLILPAATPGAEPAWFGFPITVRDDSPVSRQQLVAALERNRIGTRLLFGGNLTRQPYFAERDYRISGSLATSDQVMNNTFWLGVYPGLNQPMIDFVIDTLHGAFAGSAT
ncbi:MAG: lipopolysaccharide biosynthesis protein RfbH [Gammaproteobacteria bacterium]